MTTHEEQLELQKRIVTTFAVMIGLYFVQRDVWPAINEWFTVWREQKAALSRLEAQAEEIEAETRELESELAKEMIKKQREKKAKESAKGEHKASAPVPIKLPDAKVELSGKEKGGSNTTADPQKLAPGEKSENPEAMSRQPLPPRLPRPAFSSAPPAPPVASFGPPVYVTEVEEFARFVSQRHLTVVDFTASWCRPCRNIAPLFDQLAIMYPSVRFIKVDVDEATVIAAQQAVKSMPTFKFFASGHELDKLNGANRQKLEELVIKYRVDIDPPAPPAPVRTVPKTAPTAQALKRSYTVITSRLNPWRGFNVPKEEKPQSRAENDEWAQLRRQQDEAFSDSVAADAEAATQRDTQLRRLGQRRERLLETVSPEPADKSAEGVVLVSFRLDEKVSTGAKRVDRLFRRSDSTDDVLGFIASHPSIQLERMDSLMVSTTYPVSTIQRGHRLCDEGVFSTTSLLLLVRAKEEDG
eukprot:GSChrysophyteH1.ASY1.ANO1.2663.1 assembled CDS